MRELEGRVAQVPGGVEGIAWIQCSALDPHLSVDRAAQGYGFDGQGCRC